MSEKIRFASEKYIDNRIKLDGNFIYFPQGNTINLSPNGQDMWLSNSENIFFTWEDETLKDKINKSLLLSTPEAIHFDGKYSNKDYVIVDNINIDGTPLKLIYVFFPNIKMGSDMKSEGVLTISSLAFENGVSDSCVYLKSDNYLLSNSLYDFGFPYNVLTEQDNELVEILGKNINFPKAGLYLFTLQIDPEVSLTEFGISEWPMVYISAYSGGFITPSSEENSSLNSDWLENNPLSSSYISNRPFYTEDGETIGIFSNMTIPFINKGNDYIYSEENVPTELIGMWNAPWDYIDIVWDGVSYKCKPEYMSGAKYIGRNPFDFEDRENSPEPFWGFCTDNSFEIYSLNDGPHNYIENITLEKDSETGYYTGQLESTFLTSEHKGEYSIYIIVDENKKWHASNPFGNLYQFTEDSNNFYLLGDSKLAGLDVYTGHHTSENVDGSDAMCVLTGYNSSGDCIGTAICINPDEDYGNAIDVKIEITDFEKPHYHTVSSSMVFLGNTIPLDKKYLPELSWKDLSDVPFGGTLAGETLFEDTYSCIMTFDGLEAGFGRQKRIPIEVGKTYTVIINDTTYSPCTAIDQEGMTVLPCADTIMLIDNYPMSETVSLGILVTPETGSYTVKILQYDNDIKTIDSIYLSSITNSEIDEIFGGTIPSISYSLGENSISSNMSESIYNGDSYITTINAINGYKITDVQVLMDNTDITSNVYSDNIINIPVVSGNVEIIVSTRPPETYIITYNLTNCSSSNTIATITEGDSYNSEISCVSPYMMQECEVSMTGGGITYSTQTGGRKYEINIPEVTGNIIITAMADN